MKYPWSLTINPKGKGFEINIYENVSYTSNYNDPTELNKPDYYFVANAEELLEFLKGIYGEE